MKHIHYFILTLYCLLLSVYCSAQHCATELSQQIILQQHPELLQKRLAIEEHTKNYITQNNANQRTSVITIPVVVHVLWNTAVQNISDAQVLSQIRVLNRDYRKLNTDLNNIPSPFAPLACDALFEFCLAGKDTLGNSFNGITRTNTTKTAFDVGTQDAKYTALGGCDAWNSSLYLNIWIVPQISAAGTTGILGYAQVPGGPAETDGVVIAYNCFGDQGTLSSTYNKGRTTTHEVGHWLNLYHTWGDTNCGNDSVADTPIQQQANFGCKTFPHISCNNGPNGDMFVNYMDYSNDACLLMFTPGQSQRMHSIFSVGGDRESIAHALDSVGCSPLAVDELTEDEKKIYVFPNPSTVEINITGISGKATIKIYDIIGNQLPVNSNQLSAGEQYSIDVSSLANGIYMLEINTVRSKTFRKFVINK